MRLSYDLALVAAVLGSQVCAASWAFEDATLTVQGKGAGVGGGAKEKYGTITHAIEPQLTLQIGYRLPRRSPLPSLFLLQTV